MTAQVDVLADLRKLANVGEYRELREAMQNCLRPHERDGFADLLHRMRDNSAAVAELIEADERFNKAAWSLVQELMGQSSWTVSDADHSDWAIAQRAFLSASDDHRAALARVGGAS